MRIKVELHRDVVWYLKRRCNEKERAEFSAVQERIRSDPITLIDETDAIFEPRLSTHMLRLFRFGNNVAVFRFDPARSKIKILECYPSLPN